MLQSELGKFRVGVQEIASQIDLTENELREAEEYDGQMKTPAGAEFSKRLFALGIVTAVGDDVDPRDDDPKTDDKGASLHPLLTSSLQSVYDLINDASTLENTTYNPYYHSIASMHGVASVSSTISDKENVAVCYPMENCLLPTSKLYHYATGIAIIGYYYKNGTGTGTRMVYLGYLSHQGDAETYDINPNTIPLGTTDAMGGTTAMKYGIVRNNIYRVSIESISPLAGKLSLKVAVHDWREVTHPQINI
jgi:hypothetical protein